jgi:hypothetical protein
MRHPAELLQTTELLFGEASVNGRFRRSYQLNIVVIKSFLKYFFSYALLKMDRFLLNSKKRYESENNQWQECEEA